MAVRSNEYYRDQRHEHRRRSRGIDRYLRRDRQPSRGGDQRHPAVRHQPDLERECRRQRRSDKPGDARPPEQGAGRVDDVVWSRLKGRIDGITVEFLHRDENTAADHVEQRRSFRPDREHKGRRFQRDRRLPHRNRFCDLSERLDPDQYRCRKHQSYRRSNQWSRRQLEPWHKDRRRNADDDQRQHHHRRQAGRNTVPARQRLTRHSGLAGNDDDHHRLGLHRLRGKHHCRESLLDRISSRNQRDREEYESPFGRKSENLCIRERRRRERPSHKRCGSVERRQYHHLRRGNRRLDAVLRDRQHEYFEHPGQSRYQRP